MSSPPALAQRHPVDVHVGHQIRHLRQAAGLSQSRLAARLGVSFQQVQKYERGTNRVSCSTLYEIAGVLRAPVNRFFEGLGEPGTSERGDPNVYGLDLPPDAWELARAAALTRPRVRRRLLTLVREIATPEPASPPRGGGKTDDERA